MDRALLQRVQNLSIRSRRSAASDLLGAYRTSVKGQGLEYAESRIYERGDDIRHIDWKLTARKGLHHTKLFQEERQLHLMIGVDISASMYFGARNRTKIETATTLAALFSFAAFRQKDIIEVILFDEEVRAHFGPFRSKAQLWGFVDELEKQETSLPPVGLQSKSTLLARHVMQRRNRPQAMILLSDMVFADKNEPGDALLPGLLDLHMIQTVSRYELKPPAKTRPIFVDLETGRYASPAPLREKMLWHHPLAVVDDEEDLLRAANRALIQTHRRRR